MEKIGTQKKTSYEIRTANNVRCASYRHLENARKLTLRRDREEGIVRIVAVVTETTEYVLSEDDGEVA